MIMKQKNIICNNFYEYRIKFIWVLKICKIFIDSKPLNDNNYQYLHISNTNKSFPDQQNL